MVSSTRRYKQGERTPLQKQGVRMSAKSQPRGNLSLIVSFVVPATVLVFCFFFKSPIKSESFSLPPERPLEGVLQPNHILQKAKRLFPQELIGPESLAICNGRIYTGTYDGKILRLENDEKYDVLAQLGQGPCGKREYEESCGRPLGLKPSNNGTLYVIDSYLGLFEVDCEKGNFTRLVSNKRKFNDHPIAYGNDVEILLDGQVLFTDSNYRWPLKKFPYGVTESGAHGRLIYYNPKTKKSDIEIDMLNFPNGIQLSPKKDFLLICESTRFRIIKYYLEGERKGRYEIFVESLPGMPDNISPSRNGGYWVALAFTGVRSYFGLFDFLSSQPWLRDQALKVFSPEFLSSFVPVYGMIVELDAEGNIINSLHDPSGEVVGFVSEILDTGDALYLGSFHAPYLLKLDY